MDNDQIDLLQIKIENAKKQLSEDTLNAIAAVPWQAEIIKMRETKGFTFEQLGDLEIETELVLCGLLNPTNYPSELENRMKISKDAANELVEEMNKLVFSKIKEELIKITERKHSPLEEYSAPKAEGDGQIIHPGASATPQEGNQTNQVFKEHGIEIIPEKLELSTPAKATPQEGNNIIHPMLAQKMSVPVQTQVVKTEHTLENITKTNTPSTTPKNESPKVDPYREIPE
jgi:hypothetical protein